MTFRSLVVRSLTALSLPFFCLASSSKASAQTAPQLLPYQLSLVAGGGSAVTAGATCPSGKVATDAYGDGCLATEVLLDAPRYVTADSKGNVFISDSGNALIRRIDATTGVITLIAGGASGNSASGTACGNLTSSDFQGDSCMSDAVKLGSPMGIAINPLTGDLYFADITNYTVRKIAATNGFVTGPGIVSNVAGWVNSTAHFYGYAANTATTTIDAATQSYLDAPYGIAFDAKGILYIAEQYKQAILAVNTSSATVTVNTISIPPGTIAKLMGYRSSTYGNYCPNGTASSSGCTYGSWTSGTSASTAVMDNPYDVTADPFGNVYLANNYSSVIAIGQINSAGVINTYAGKQALGDVVNTRGTANQVYIGTPFGVTADANGNIYTSDSTTGWIWRVDAANQGIFVLAGAGTSCNASGAGDGCPASATKFSTGTLRTSSNHSYASTPGVAGLYAAQDGSLYVTDAAANLVHKLSTNTNFGTILPTNPIQTIDIHFASGDGPGANAYALTTNPENFTIGQASCASNSDGTSDCLLPITATPQAEGAFSSVLQITSSLGKTTTTTLSGVLTLDQVNSTTTLTASSTNVNPATEVTLTATVQQAGGTTAGTGTVSFYNGSTLIGTAQTLNNGSASITTTFPAGSYSLTAVYEGSLLLFGSTSSTVQLASTIPTYSLSQTPTSQTIVQGQTALATFTLSSLGGYTGTVSFACSGLPSNASCEFAPSTVSVTTAASTVVMSVKTVSPIYGAVSVPVLPGTTQAGRVALCLLPGAALILLGLRRRMRTRLPGKLLLLAVSCLAAMGAIGCSEGKTSYDATPTGSYTVTVTATGTPNVLSTATITQTSTLSLTVNKQ